MRLLLAIFTSLLIASSSLFSQSLSVFDIDTTNFPTMKSKFYAFDASGNQIKNLSPSDFEVTENSTLTRSVTNVTCPPDKPLQTVSVAMSLDVSGSMSFSEIGEIPVELGKITATDLCKAIAMPPSEFALQTCDDKALIIQDFTKDRNKILTSIAPITANGNNDFVEHLMNKLTGLLNIAKTGKNKRVAVIYTDAWWDALSPQELQQCKDTCARYDIQFYAVIYSRPEAEQNGIKKSLQELADATGGYLYDGITSTAAAKDIAKNLQSSTQGAEPCEITWQSGVSCFAGITNTELRITDIGLTDNASYPSPSLSVAKLEFSPTYIAFRNPPIGKTVSQYITVTARNFAFTVTDIKVSNLLFDISPKSFTLNANESKTLTISYTAKDSGRVFSKFIFENTNHCNKDFYASAGWKGVKPAIPTLKVTHPNGGELFAVGSDTVITWDGIPVDELVRLEYSIDNGITWKYIDTVRGLSYRWNKVPKPTSNQSLVRVSQIEEVNGSCWSRTYGGSDKDNAHSIIKDRKGNYVVAGGTWSNNGDVHGNKGREDYWILKINPQTGDTIWTKTYGGGNCECANSIIEDNDGNYVVAGYTGSTNGDVQGFKGNTDYWILKLNPITGDTIWTKTYGGSDVDMANSIREDNDGNYVVAGMTGSTNGDVHGNKGGTHYWILKLNPITGDTIWTKTYGGSGGETAYSVIKDSDGDYVVAGISTSNNSEVHSNKVNPDYWILKINPINGDTIWTKTYGGSDDDTTHSILEDSDGNYVLLGYSRSINGDVHGNKGFEDYWILKLNPITGDTIWTKTYGGSSRDYAHSIIEDSDGNYVVAGCSQSTNGDVHEKKGYWDYWILKINPLIGDTIWTKTYGGSWLESANSIIEDNDRTYVVAGDSQSNNGDVPENKGMSDYWILKISEPKELQFDISDSLFAIVAPELKATVIDMNQCLVNSIKDSLFTGFIQNSGNYKCRIDSIYFTGADANAFSLVSGLPVYTVAAGKDKATEFRFMPKRVGTHTAKVVIITQADTLIQNIIGEGVQPMLKVVNNLIDFGQVNIGEPRDTIQALTIQNVGTAPLTITSTKHNLPDDQSFSTISGGGNFTIGVGATHKMDLRFIPTSTDLTNGILEFHYNGLGSPAEILLIGKGVAPEIEIVNSKIDFGKVLLGSDSTIHKAITIANTRTGKLKITDVKITNPEFARLSGLTAFDLLPGDTLKYDLKFTPSKIGPATADLAIYHNQANSPTKVQLIGEGYEFVGNASATIQALNISANAGEIIELPIILKNQANLVVAKITSLKVEVSFNPTLLYPLDFPVQTIDQNTSKITIENLPINIAIGQPLTKIKFKAALGNAEDCNLILSNAEAIGGNATINPLNGTFTLLGVCHEGGTRLVNPNANIGIQSITPNPAKDKITITAKITEIDTKIKLIDIAGKVIKEIDCAVDKTKVQDFTIDLTNIPAGMYFIEFKSPNFSQVEKVVVEK